MVALRLYAVGLLLMPVWAEAAAPWNSTDMSYKLIADQKIQAQKSSEPNITLPEEPPLPDCHDSTGGTCRWFNCHASRHAECCDNNHAGQPFCPDGPTYKCLCPAGTCAVDGVCQDRGSPVLLASPSTELRAEPAAASTVLLAAAARTVTALLVMRRRRTPEIHMPEYVLG